MMIEEKRKLLKAMEVYETDDLNHTTGFICICKTTFEKILDELDAVVLPEIRVTTKEINKCGAGCSHFGYDKYGAYCKLSKKHFGIDFFRNSFPFPDWCELALKEEKWI